MLVQMQGEAAQYGVRLAGGIYCRSEAGMEPLDSDSDGTGAALGTVPAQPGTLAQVFCYLLQLAQGLGLHRVAFQAVSQHALQLALAAPQYPHRRRVLQAHD